MKKTGIIVLLLIGLGSMAFNNWENRTVENTSFKQGEVLTYKMQYGFLTIGHADVSVHSKIFDVNSKPCYRVNVSGQTAGLASLWKVKNTYRSFMDTTTFLPQKFIYSARENDFKRDQTFIFDHYRNTVKRTEKEETKIFKTVANVQDLVSYYYLVRTQDFSKKPVGSSITTPMFFNDKMYNITMKYVGKEVIKTKYGKISVLKLYPILPNDMLFEGEGAIRIYVSDDENHIPVRFEIDFSFGTIDMELIGHKGERSPIKWG
jgi:hypothetical protein